MVAQHNHFNQQVLPPDTTCPSCSNLWAIIRETVPEDYFYYEGEMAVADKIRESLGEEAYMEHIEYLAHRAIKIRVAWEERPAAV